MAALHRLRREGVPSPTPYAYARNVRAVTGTEIPGYRIVVGAVTLALAIRVVVVRILRRLFFMPGPGTSVAEVTHVSRHGFWLLLDAEELLVPFASFPWFGRATIDQLVEVQCPTPDHLYWPQSDVDLSVASIRNPDDFPLIAHTNC